MFRHRKEILHAFQVTDANTQTAVRLYDLRYTETRDRLLNSRQHAMLIHVEEKQLLERGSLLDAKGRLEGKGVRVFQQSPQ
jgi:uncharacterized protein YfaA (DUF2138 family)